MSDLDLRLLRLLEAIHRTGSVTRAALSLGLSQPTVSIGLGQLRAHYGDPLFVQTAEGMTPTPFAQEIIGPVRQTLHDIRQLSAQRATFEPALTQRCFRVAMSDASHFTLLPQLFAALRAQAPEVRLEACPIEPSLGAHLTQGEVDLAIGLIPSLHAGFYQRALYDQDWVTLLRSGHPLGALTRAAFIAAEHVEVTNGTGNILLQAALDAARLNLRFGLSLPGFLGLPSVLSASDLLATLPRHIGTKLAAQNGLSVRECPIPIARFQVKLHWHARLHADPAHIWLRETAFAALAHIGQAT